VLAEKGEIHICCECKYWRRRVGKSIIHQVSSKFQNLQKTPFAKIIVVKSLAETAKHLANYSGIFSVELGNAQITDDAFDIVKDKIEELLAQPKCLDCVITKKCFKCEYLPCINFLETRKNYHGELTLLAEVPYPPCIIGSVIYSLCQILVSIAGTRFYDILHQCIRDLKAAAFLLMSGHYRNALQILEPVLQNLLAALYFDKEFGLASQKRVEKEWQEFKVGQWKKTQPSTLKQLQKHGIIDESYTKRVNEIRRELNKYLHSTFLEMNAEIITEDICGICPASGYHDKKEFQISVKIFQDITALLLVTLRHYCLQVGVEKDEIKKATWYLRETKNVEKAIGAKLIFSKDLEKLIENILD
jgi:hypothetical protein